MRHGDGVEQRRNERGVAIQTENRGDVKEQQCDGNVEDGTDGRQRQMKRSAEGSDHMYHENYDRQL